MSPRAVACALLVLVLPACRGHKETSTPPAPTAVPLAGIDVHTEEQWIVTDTAAHIARWQGRKPSGAATLVEPRGATPSYLLKMSDRAVTLSLNDYVWSPANFASLATVPAAPGPASCDLPNFLTRLLTPTVRTLAEADDLVSKRLQEAPDNPCLHEAAAILIAVFQMREVAFQFDDHRPALNRMAAHLAIARALRQGAAPGLEGRLADLMLRAVAWRHDGFPEEIKGYAEKATEPEKTWLRVVSLYSVQDWRELNEPTKATLAERLSYLQALSNKTSPNRVLAFLEQGTHEKIADWPRLAFQRGVTVEMCGTYGETGPPAVFGEIVEAYKRLRGGELTAATLVGALNDESYGDALRVLDWPLWAAFEQRVLAAALRDQYDCLELSYGDHAAASSMRQSVASRLGQLRLAPFLLAWMSATPAEYTRSATAGVAILKERPEWVSYGNWAKVSFPHHRVGPAPGGAPDARSWFAPLVPYGTALNFNIRFTAGLPPSRELAEAAMRHGFSVLAKRLYAESLHGHTPPVPFLKTLYGPTVEYDRDALVSIAHSARSTDPAEFLAATRAMCAMEADDCDVLAEYLKDHGDAEGAAREYQRWFDGARDRVRVSNRSDWLVDYYFEHGETDKALRVARDVAGTYSERGLETFAGLEEKLNHLTEAEQYYRKVHERYDEIGPLYEFFGRHQQDPGVKKSLDAVLASVFPGGRTPARVEDFGFLPPDGATVADFPQDHEPRCGLEIRDRIVGLDGIRIHDLSQLRLQNRLSAAPEIDVIYWRAGKVTQAHMPRLSVRSHRYDPR